MATQDHDQRMKLILMEMPGEFLALTQPPAWASHLDFAGLEWVPQEIFLDPPQGQKVLLDLVAKVPLKKKMEGGFNHALLHYEIEARKKLTVLK